MDRRQPSIESADQDGHKRRWRHRLRHLLAFGHDHDSDHAQILSSGRAGMRATKISLVGLGVTAVFQLVVFSFSGSVALLSDTLHNFTDALTAIPLWIAFSIGLRQPTRTYTYGFRRAEDLIGLVIVAAIGASAAGIIWESIRRLIDPIRMDHIPWVIAAGLIGAVGNELVARYRIRVGRAIGSEALITDGHHARTDSFTSLAVVAAGVGSALGAPWVDPIAGLVVAVGIMWLLVRSAKRLIRRLLDGIDFEIVSDAEAVILGVEGVGDISDLRARWQGHQLNFDVSVAVDPDLTVRSAHEIAQNVEHALHHAFQYDVSATIHVDPHATTDAHRITAHHRSK